MNEVLDVFTSTFASTFMLRHSFYITLFSVALISFFLYSCSKEITVDVPTAEPKIVVEGTIYNDQPPLILLTWSQGYFDPLDPSSLASLFVHDALVTITTDGVSYTLQEVRTSELSPEQLEAAADALGVPPDVLASLELCVYTTFELFGEPSKIYKLHVESGDHILNAQTKIPELVFLDTLFFNIVSSLPNDSLGFIFGNITDPDTSGNAYRWFAKRINHYPQWVEDDALRGEQKDFGYIAPLGSVFDDSFFNGLSFEFGYWRGEVPNSGKFDDLNLESGFFKRGDTVAVRGCTIDRQSYKFIYSFESQVNNQGSPFSVPFNLETNIVGGYGAFIGYGAVYDTVICY